MSDTAITHRPIAALTPWARNARTHSKKQIRQMAASIQQFGFTNPVLIDEAGTIWRPRRVAAAQRLGMTEVPCLRLDHMTENQKRAYVLADNKLALNAGWDEDLLAAELGALLSADLDFDVGLTGFTIPEIDGVLETVAPEEPDDPPGRCHAGRRARPGPPGGGLAARDAPADLWRCARSGRGRHADGRDQARMVFTDPPYHVPIDGHAGGLGQIRHREFAMAAGGDEPRGLHGVSAAGLRATGRAQC